MNRDYVRERILTLLDEIRNEMEDELERDREPESSYASVREHMDDIEATLSELIKSRTEWLEAGQVHGPLRWHVPAWYLNWQEEMAQALVVRSWLKNLVQVVPRLENLPPLLLQDAPPPGCRLLLGEAAQCYLFGLFRSSVALSRTALETMLRSRVRELASAELVQEEDSLLDLVRAAGRAHLLSAAGVANAHRVRKLGNKAAHGEPIADAEVQTAIALVRRIAEELFRGDSDIPAT